MKKELKAATMVFPTPTLIVGSYNEDGTANAMNVAWGGVCASEPPCVQISIRAERKTRENIDKRKAFTLHISGKSLMDKSDYIGIVSGHSEDKIGKLGLTVSPGRKVDAPVIEDYPLALECEVRDICEVGSHIMIIGEVKAVLAEDEILDDKGKIDVTRLAPLAFDPAGGNYIVCERIAGKAFSAGLKYKK